MPALPSGTVTLLFTDIEGSTRLLRRLGDAYAEVLADHQRLLREAFTAFSGHEVDTQGDSFFVSFARATDAVAAATDAQWALAAHPWPDDVTVRVRMGLHTGEPLAAAGRYVGLAVHKAARVGAAGHGGQVLLSAATQAVLRDQLPDDLTLRDLGEHRLKDFDEPEHLYQVLIPGLPVDFPALKTLGLPANARPGATLPPPAILIGRDQEQALLRERLGAALAGRGSVVLIGGEAGIGKTSIAESLAHEAVSDGALVLVGRCYDLTETPPYGPWRDLLARLPSSIAPPAVFVANGEGTGLPNQAALFDQVRDFFARLAQQQPVIILLDDLHWADPASLDLLRALSRELASLALLILVTYRSDELTRRHPLSQTLPSLVREAHAERLALRRLGHDDLRALVRKRYGLPAVTETQLVAYLRDHAEGNPFYTGELLRDLEEERLLSQIATGWQLHDLASARVPPLLRQVIEGRLARLNEETQRLLAIAAVIGQRVPLPLWATVAGATEETLVEALEEATIARLVEESDGGAAIRFSHALIREALYEGVLPQRRRLSHRRVAEALATTAHPDADAVAGHFQRAGDARAVGWLVRAGEEARRAYALLTAAERFGAALTILDSQGGDLIERAILLYRLARMQRYADPRAALVYLDDAETLANEGRDELLVAYIACARGYLRCTVGQIRHGLAELEAHVAAFAAQTPLALDRLTHLQERLGDPADEHHYRGALASWLSLAGRYREAQGHGERVVADTTLPLAHGAGTSYYANACRGLASAHAALGQPTEARQYYTAAHDAYRRAEHWYQVGNTQALELYEVALPFHADHLQERQRLADSAAAAWEQARDVLADLPTRLAHVPLLLLEGAWDEVRAITLAVRAPGTRTQWRPFASSLLAQLARNQGEAELARALIHERLPRGANDEPGDTIFLDALTLQRLAASLAIEADDLPAAHAWLTAHDRWLAWSGAILGQSEGHLLWARYHRATDNLTGAYHHASGALAAAGAPRQPLALLAARRLLGELAASGGDVSGATTHLDQALALADACAAPFERALTMLAHAELHATTGDTPAALAALAMVEAICTPLAAKPTLARAAALAARLRNTD